ncbi:hypothetical protein DF037_28715 [Burkholderia contaminans]|uniref:Uncharacterized protein n=1 Tax=Burkholderia contaminans TaxID=488447 RepID=A0A3N8QE68_9BURK|nr:hypothetical protein DF037_28715 [Burkholderia contaminans]
MLLADAIVDACVMEYDQATGEGYFVVVDGDAPAAGTTIELDADAVPEEIKTYEHLSPASSATSQAFTIEQFYDELDRHDWYYSFSDDGREYRSGSDNAKRLSEIAQCAGGDHAALLDAFNKHYFSGDPWSTPKWDKPARPANGVVSLPAAPVPVSATPESSEVGAQSHARPDAQCRDEVMIELAEYETTCISNVITAAYAWRDARCEYSDATRLLKKPRTGRQFNWIFDWWRRRSDSAAQLMAARSLGFAEHQLQRALVQLMNTGYDADMGREKS